MIALFSWIAVAGVVSIFGKLCESAALSGIGAIMLIMTAMVAGVEM